MPDRDGDMLRASVFAAGFASALLAFSGASALQDEPGAGAVGHWVSAERLENGRAGLSVGVIGDRLFAAGGAGLTDPRNDLEAYDPVYDQWLAETPLPRGLERFGMAVHGGRLYAAGGFAAGDPQTGFETEVVIRRARPSADMWSYDPDGGVWQREPAMPSPRSNFALVASGDRLYALGGAGDATVFAYDPGEQAWETLDAPAETARIGAAAVAHDGLIYLIGGVIDNAATARVDVFDPDSASWRRAADLPDARASVAAAVYQGRIHIFGGRGADLSMTLTAHSAYDPASDSWSERPDLPSPRTEADAGVLEGRVYLVGGGSGGGFFAPFTALAVTDVYVEEN